MSIFKNESYSFVVFTLLFIGLIIVAAFLAVYFFRQSKKSNKNLFRSFLTRAEFFNVLRNFNFYGFIFCLICVLCGLWAVSIEPRRIVVRDFEIKNTGLPPMKIAVISDLHLRFGKSEKFVTRVVQKINEQNPDMVMIPGDFLTSGADKYATKLIPLQDITAPVYFVLGNHDYKINAQSPVTRPQILRKNLRQAELVELKNESIFLSDKNISLVGVEDNYLNFDDLDTALAKVKTEPFILLAHSPDIVDEFRSSTTESRRDRPKPSLIISGHTHCGQIRLPFIGAMPGVIPTDHGKEYDKHWYPEQNMFVSCGVGESGPAIRFMNPPEVVVLEID
jgi:predicted MPP superfamily phosphohydrolase